MVIQQCHRQAKQTKKVTFKQCYGSMKFQYSSECGSIPLTNGSGCFLLCEGTFYTIFQKIKVINKTQNSRNQCFSYYFCLMIEGSGSISLTNGSGFGSRRPKNIWIIRIRISNNYFQYTHYQLVKMLEFFQFHYLQHLFIKKSISTCTISQVEDMIVN